MGTFQKPMVLIDLREYNELKNNKLEDIINDYREALRILIVLFATNLESGPVRREFKIELDRHGLEIVCHDDQYPSLIKKRK